MSSQTCVGTTSSQQHCAANSSWHHVSNMSLGYNICVHREVFASFFFFFKVATATTHHVSWLLNFLVTTFPSSRPRRSAIFWDRSGCELPLNILIFGIFLRSRASFSPSRAAAVESEASRRVQDDEWENWSTTAWWATLRELKCVTLPIHHYVPHITRATLRPGGWGRARFHLRPAAVTSFWAGEETGRGSEQGT